MSGVPGATAGSAPVIQVTDLVREFRRPKRISGPFGGLRTLFTRQAVTSRAVDGVSFAINTGELVGYLGPNGAGKSTTIKVLTGILVPTSGTVRVAGVVPWRDRERNAQRIGAVFGQRSQLWWDLPLRDSLRLIGKLYELPGPAYHATLERLSSLLGLDEFVDVPVRQLSLGQRMRGDLAAAMLHGPRILYLDEPTIGLDVVAKERVREFIAEINREDRTTIILTTHDLDDVERLCSRIILIGQGRVLYDGDVEQLKARYLPHRELVVTLADHQRIDLPGTETVRVADGKVWLRFDAGRHNVADMIGAVVARHQVRDLSIVEPDLEQVIQRIWQQRGLEQG